MSNLEHELMAAERALRAIAEKAGAEYVAFHFYRNVTPFAVGIHNGQLVRHGHKKTLNEALDAAVNSKPFDATPKAEDVA